MDIRKYFLKDRNSAVFVLRGTNINNVSNRIVNLVPATVLIESFSTPPEWSIKIEASNNGFPFFSTEFFGTGFININQDITDNGVITIADNVLIAITIFNPSSITGITSLDFEQNWSTTFVTVVACTGLGEFKNITTVPYWLTEITPENLFLLNNVTTIISWVALDILNWDDRFGLGGFTGLQSFTLSFPYNIADSTHNVDMLKKLTGLTTLGYLGNDTVDNVTNNYDFPFDPAFNYPILSYFLSEYSKPDFKLTAIPVSIKYLRLLEIFTFETGDATPFDFTYPLIAGADNTVIQSIVCGTNCRLTGITFPSNLEQLTAFTTLSIGFALRNGGYTVAQDKVFNDFYTLYYSKCYNETNNTKPGYTISQTSLTSGYFSTITPPAGRVLNSFLNATLNASNGPFTSGPLQTKAEEINATGFNLTAVFLGNSVPLLLNNTPAQPSIAYSLRLLNANYTGSAVRVRRSSDNAEKDIGFVSGAYNIGLNAYDQSTLDTVTLLDFCGGGNGYVTIIYDQSGNGNNAVQTTAAKQAGIVTAGALYLLGTNPCLHFDGIDDFYTFTDVDANYPRSSFVVSKKDDSNAMGMIISHNGVGTGSYTPLDYSDGVIYYRVAGTTNNRRDASGGVAVQRLLTGISVTSSDMSIYDNGINLSATTTANTTSIAVLNTIGGRPNSAIIYSKGVVQEILLYGLSNQSANRVAIETDINNFYTIY